MTKSYFLLQYSSIDWENLEGAGSCDSAVCHVKRLSKQFSHCLVHFIINTVKNNEHLPEAIDISSNQHKKEIENSIQFNVATHTGFLAHSLESKLGTLTTICKRDNKALCTFCFYNCIRDRWVTFLPSSASLGNGKSQFLQPILSSLLWRNIPFNHEKSLNHHHDMPFTTQMLHTPLQKRNCLLITRPDFYPLLCHRVSMTFKHTFPRGLSRRSSTCFFYNLVSKKNSPDFSQVLWTA